MLNKNINEGIELLKQNNYTIKEIEKKINNKSFHKLTALIKKYYPNQNKLNNSQIEFLIGKLREQELNYAKVIKDRKRGQKKLSMFFRGDLYI